MSRIVDQVNNRLDGGSTEVLFADGCGKSRLPISLFTVCSNIGTVSKVALGKLLRGRVELCFFKHINTILN